MAIEVNEPEVGRLFRRLSDRRLETHYERETPSAEEALDRIAATEQVISVVERFLAQQDKSK